MIVRALNSTCLVVIIPRITFDSLAAHCKAWAVPTGRVLMRFGLRFALQRCVDQARVNNQQERKPNMATQTQVKTGSEQSSDLEQKVQKLRGLYADAPEIGKTALEN